ncbi:MAG: HAD-IC family P-type ATPase [Actinobacteria bacterium]|nr:HAD-IC family P-type ATPase [Actinomycetota bacterium]
MDLSQATENAHSLPADEVVTLLDSDASSGLSNGAVARRQEQFGLNQLPAAPQPGPLKLLWEQFRSVFIIVLLAAAALNFVIWILDHEENLPYDTIVIIAIVLANAALGFFQDYKAEKSLEKLKLLSGPEATLIRGGSRRRVPAVEIVPGDLLVLAAGDKVSSDARLCEVNSLEMNESSLTGESATVMKTASALAADEPLADRTNMVYAGTTVTHGRGLAIVTSTGASTEVGKIATLIQSVPSRDTPLKENLDRLAKRLALIILLVSAAVSATGLLVSGRTDWKSILNLLLFGVALAVAAIPEGLPAVVTGSLALGTQRMVRRKAVIRKLPAVETLGSTSAICSDKTGTLTMGQMTVRELVLPSGTVTLGGAGYRPDGEVDGGEEALEEARSLAMSAVLCNDATVHQDEDGSWKAVGAPTEAALITMAAKLGLETTHLKQENRRLAEEPFSSERKRMTVVVSAGGGGAMLHSKGAPERLIPLCTSVIRQGRIEPLTDDDRRQLLETAAGMAARELRSLAVARRLASADAAEGVAAYEEELIFLGLAGIYDPPRPEAAAAIEECTQAGIEVFMVTGDHRATAESIAAELGIRGSSMTGPEIDRATDEELEQHVADAHIFARVSPGHKVRIVAALQRRGHTVAVTGDGVNDAPALKQADIGVAMGLSGTDVAREAADMVLLDDNFATIVAAIEEGRSIFLNIRKFLGFLLSSNSGLVLTLFLGVMLASPLGLMEDGQLVLPLLAVQILWINLVTNGPPALALGVDPREADAMLAPPRPRTESVVNATVLKLIIFVGLVSGIGGLVVLSAYFPEGFIAFRENADITYAQTMTFVVLTLFQLFDSINFRSLTGSVLNRRLAGNPWLLGALALSAVMMVAVVHWHPLQVAFHTTGLLPEDWLIAVAFASIIVWAVELFKVILRWGERKNARRGTSPIAGSGDRPLR